MALTPEDLKMITDAISQTDWAQWAVKAMQAEAAESNMDDAEAGAAIDPNNPGAGAPPPADPAPPPAAPAP